MRALRCDPVGPMGGRLAPRAEPGGGGPLWARGCFARQGSLRPYFYALRGAQPATHRLATGAPQPASKAHRDGDRDPDRDPAPDPDRDPDLTLTPGPSALTVTAAARKSEGDFLDSGKVGATCGRVSNPYFKAASVIAMALGTGVAACASAGAPASGAVAAPTMLTAAELSSASPASAMSPTEVPASREGSVGAETREASAPKGKLVCRTHNCVDGTTELYLDWDGKVASGTLRTTAPSGMVYEKKVRAERYQGTIVVDEPSGTDLAEHAAMVVEQSGKLHMRVGAPGQAVSACE